MTETKYGKYFLNELPSEIREQGYGKTSLVWSDDSIINGSECFSVRIYTERSMKVAHGPHIHKDPEVLVFISMDPDNPKDLGGEVEICMGKEMEKHYITETTLVYIPAYFLHCPMKITRMERPFIFVRSQYAPMQTERSFPQLVKEEDRENMLFFNVGWEKKE